MTRSPHAAPAWTNDQPGAGGVRLVRLPTASIDALAAGDLHAARAATDIALTEFVASSTCRRVWSVRSEQLATSPTDADWVTRVVVTGDGTVVGRAGFHGPLRATISPDNTASRDLVTSHGLIETGEQWDDEDGLEAIFEASL